MVRHPTTRIGRGAILTTSGEEAGGDNVLFMNNSNCPAIHCRLANPVR